MTKLKRKSYFLSIRIALSKLEAINPTESSGIWSRFKTVIQTSHSNQNLKHIQQEIKFLEEFSRQLFLEIVDIQRTLDRIRFSKTLQGKYFNFLGYFFSIYCVYKIIIVSHFLIKENYLVLN
jgi:hypothetical protein